MPIEAAVRTESSAVRFRENDSDYNYINSIRQAQVNFRFGTAYTPYTQSCQVFKWEISRHVRDRAGPTVDEPMCEITLIM